jgi:hypothetical protein
MSAQSTLLSTVSLPEFTDLVRRSWLETQAFLPRNAMAMFIRDDLGMHNGSSKLYNEYDTETYADDKPEGSPAQKSKVGVGYSKTMYIKTIGKSIDVTIEDRTQNRYPEVQAKLNSLNNFCANRIDLDLTHRLTFATSTSYTNKNGETVDTTTGDTNALADTTHDLAFSSTTYSNRVAGDPAFSQTAFEAALLLASTNIYSNFGERRTMNWNVIFHGEDPTAKREIDQLINSTADVDAVQAGVENVYKGRYTRVYLPNLSTTATGAYDSTKRRWWGIACVGQGMLGWQGIYGEVLAPFIKTPAPGNNGEDVDTWNWTYSTGAMYGIVTPNPRGIVMSCPTS